MPSNLEWLLDPLRGHTAVRFSRWNPGPREEGRVDTDDRSEALASMTSIPMPVIPRSNVDGCWRDIDRWRDVNRWRWRVINRRWRCDVHRLRCDRAADNGPDAKSQQPCTYSGAIPCSG
jgi:hypothetical protein